MMWKMKNNTCCVNSSHFEPVLKTVSISPTYKCDCRCNFCHTWGDNGWAHNSCEANKELNVEVIKKFLTEANQGEQRLNCLISGGEPLVYSQFDSLVSFSKQNDIFTKIITSGGLLKKKAEIVFNNVDEVTVSLSGPQQLNDRIRGKRNHFRMACDGIEELLKLKIENESTFPNIMINLVLTEDTQAHVDEYINCIKERFKHLGTEVYLDYDLFDITESEKKQLQVDKENRLINGIALVFEPLLYTNEEQGEKYKTFMQNHFNIEVSDTWKGFLINKDQIDSELLTKTFHRLWDESGIDYSNFVGFHEYFNDLESTFGHTHCYNPWNTLRIRPDGSANFCSDLPDYKLGNIVTDGFIEIWHGKRAEDFRDVLKNELTPMCKRCDGIIFAADDSENDFNIVT